jgi:hypothetical protein
MLACNRGWYEIFKGKNCNQDANMITGLKRPVNQENPFPKRKTLGSVTRTDRQFLPAIKRTQWVTPLKTRVISKIGEFC